MPLRKSLTCLSLLMAAFLTPTFLFAQNKDTAFQQKWKEIDSLIFIKNLSQTALNKVNTLYLQAKQEKNGVQLIKCLIYSVSLGNRVNETDPNRNIKLLETEIEENKDVVIKSILYSLTAQQYLAYFNNNRWRFYNRSQTISFKKEDITTWSNDDFQNAITRYYLLSTEAAPLLQQIKLEPYDALIIKGNARNLRPTLYDLLAHEALDYFKTGVAYLTKPAYAFVIDNEKALAKMEVFLDEKFTSNDSNSHLVICLQLFQQLIAFHKKDAGPEALTDVDIERIIWVNQQAVFINKAQLYKEALQEIINIFPNNSSSAEAGYLLARIYADQAQTYSPQGDTSHRFDYVQAIHIAEKALNQFKEKNAGTTHLGNLITEINEKNIHLQTEEVNIPGKPFRTLVDYKNADTLYGRIINIDANDSILDRQYEQDIWGYITHLPSIRNFYQKLPSTQDYQQHSTEIKIDVLPAGRYMMITSSGKQFIPDSDKLAMQFFNVSNISYVKNNDDYFVLNRETGRPINNATVTVLKRIYNYAQKKSYTERVTAGYTDKNGHLKLSVPDGNRNERNFELIIETKNDRLHLRENEYLPYRDDETMENNLNKYEKRNVRLFFFTDRSIYRPGQKVFFKGIAITKDKDSKQSKLYIKKGSILIYLKDVNFKNIDSVSCIQNEFGSFTGSFMIPQNVLTGKFTIQAKSIPAGTSSFNIEEYKRPQFYVAFEKIKSSYQLNDSITITGLAKAFAGNIIDGARVTFNVKRSARFLYPWLFHNGIRPFSNYTEITHGEIISDTAGKFNIRFKALPDLNIDKQTGPVFDFSVEAEVTDINGETRKASNNISIGYQSLLLQIEAPAITPCDSIKKQINISTKNMAGEKEPAVVHVRLYSLQAPQRLIRQRLWSRPDQFIMDRASYIRLFPNDDYDDENNYQNWPGKLLSDKVIDTKNITRLWAEIKFKPGYYKIEASTVDKQNRAVKDVHYIQLFNNSDVLVPTNDFSYTINGIAEPGQKAVFVTGSSAENIFVIRQTFKPGKKTNNNFEYIERNKGIHQITYTPVETDRGNISIQEVFVKNNRVYTNNYPIVVPWSNKKLQVTYKTFRDKTEPGSKEKWTISINGGKGTKPAAELLTTLYDASLDQFAPHTWTVPDVWPVSYYNPWSVFSGFNQASSQTNGNHILNYDKDNIYDQLAKDASAFLMEPFYAVTDSSEAVPGNETFIRNDMVRKNLTGLVLRGAVAKSKQEENYDKVFTTVDIVDEARGLHIINGRSIKLRNDEPAVNNAIVSVRKNFSETAFFFPQLQADSSGNYSFTFTMPEALTQWKWMSLAHTKDLAFGSNSAIITTQKTLMVQPNAPRFMREGDQMEFVGKVVNLSNKELTGQVSFELTEPSTGISVDGWFQNIFPVQYFTIRAGQSSEIKFPIQVPFNYNKPLTWKVTAKAGNYSDGEENTLPVLTNRKLVTESLPLLIKGDTAQHFTFSKLFNNNSESLTNEAITVEYTANPVWYAVQALPYLMEYPYECAEQTFNRLYANGLAAGIVNKHPRIKALLEKWENDTIALKSNLQKDEELKQTMLEEMPWVIQAENEEQQKKNIGLLFDIAKMSYSTNTALEKLKQMQLPDGSFSWFKGGQEDRYITNYIMTGIGKLKKTNILSKETEDKTTSLLNNAIVYLDNKTEEDYHSLLHNKTDTSKQNISTQQIQYLYMRSFFPNDSLAGKDAYSYYYRQAKRFWNKQNLYNQALLGLVFYRNNDRQITLGSIIPSITENAINNEQGMYWKETYTSFWYQSPIEYQSLMIDLLNEINQQEKSATLAVSINNMKTWLILNKQTNNWKTTIATAEACYALLLNGDDLLNTNRQVKIQLDDTSISDNNETTEAGAGYFKKRIEGKSVKPEMGNITVSTTSDNQHPATGISYGSIYWSYFEDMDKLTEASSHLSLHKKLFIENITDKGKELTPVNENDELKVGDKVIVRIELKSDRDMEYLHLKDTRAAGMEPVNVLSGYKWQDGLGYYETTMDASTNFFIGNLKKGTYVFEYPLYVTNPGLFSVGIATIQCTYAPEFTSHSEGIKIRVIPNH